jgi:hypothetical protein
LAGLFNGNYSRFINTEKHMKNLSYGLDMSGSLKNSNYQNNARSFNLSNVHFNLDDYFYKGNSFLVNRCYLSGSFNVNEVDPTQPIQKQRDYNLKGQYEIGIGKGRLEYISDPVLANFILKDMKKKEIIDSYSPNQVESFGNKISQILSIRMIDYRFRMIDQISMLDSFLSKEVINQKSNAIYFTSLYDNWLYANRFQRFSGQRNEFLIGNNVWDNNSRQKFKSDSIQNRNYFYNTFYLAYQYSSENPVRLAFQRSRIFRAEIRKENSATDYSLVYSSYKNKSYQINLAFTEGIGWYPNTRTYLSTSVKTQVNYQFKHSLTRTGWLDYNLGDILTASLSPNANLYYFFSPRFKLNASASLDLNYFKFWNQSSNTYFNLGTSFNAGISYVFF